VFYRRWGKRSLDVVIAPTLFILTVPIMAVVALAVRVCLGSPVLFRQQRAGLHGTTFSIIKFRSMQPNPNEQILADSERLTSFGLLLRSSSLDELPQLINILRGDMSLVGPRPLLPKYLPRYSPQQARRHEVRPGLTGLAQVCGRNELAWAERFVLDVTYVDTYSLGLDTKILLRTVIQSLRSTGTTPRDSVTMPEFE